MGLPGTGTVLLPPSPLSGVRASSLLGKRPKAFLLAHWDGSSLLQPMGEFVQNPPKVLKVKSSRWFGVRDVTKVFSNPLGWYAASVSMPQASPDRG